METIVSLLRHPAVPYLVVIAGILVLSLLVEQIIGILKDKEDDGEF